MEERDLESAILRLRSSDPTLTHIRLFQVHNAERFRTLCLNICITRAPLCSLLIDSTSLSTDSLKEIKRVLEYSVVPLAHLGLTNCGIGNTYRRHDFDYFLDTFPGNNLTLRTLDLRENHLNDYMRCEVRRHFADHTAGWYQRRRSAMLQMPEIRYLFLKIGQHAAHVLRRYLNASVQVIFD